MGIFILGVLSKQGFFSIHAVHCFTAIKPYRGFSTFYLGSVFGVAKKKALWLLLPIKTKFLEKWETERGNLHTSTLQNISVLARENLTMSLKHLGGAGFHNSLFAPSNFAPPGKMSPMS